MILIQVALYSPLRENYIPHEAIIDTGANICAIAGHIAERFGLDIEDGTVHLWQVRDPLVLRRIKLNILYNGQEYSVEAVVVDIPENLRRAALPEEECTRPLHAHPLSSRIVLGENFFSQLPESDGRSIGLV